MAKRRDIVRLLERNGFINSGGTKHDRFQHPDGRWTTVERHQEIPESTKEKIIKQAKLK